MGNAQPVNVHFPKDILLKIFREAISKDVSLAIPISKTCKWAKNDKTISAIVRREMSKEFDEVFFVKKPSFFNFRKYHYMVMFKMDSGDKKFQHAYNDGNDTWYIRKNNDGYIFEIGCWSSEGYNRDLYEISRILWRNGNVRLFLKRFINRKEEKMIFL